MKTLATSQLFVLLTAITSATAEDWTQWAGQWCLDDVPVVEVVE